MPSPLAIALESLVGYQTLRRGESYASSGRVKNWRVARDHTFMNATVRGTSLYDQAIEFTWSAPGNSRVALASLSGLCSCPVGFNCKHVVAAVLAAEAAGDLVVPTLFAAARAAKPSPDAASDPWSSISDPNAEKEWDLLFAASRDVSKDVAGNVAGNTERDGARVTTPAASFVANIPKSLGDELSVWLKLYPQPPADSLEPERLVSGPNAYPPNVKDRVRYVVKQFRDQITVSPMKVMLLKDGAISLGDSTKPQPYVVGNINYERPPRFVLPIDLRIFKLLNLLGRSHYCSDFALTDDEESQTLFRLLLESERAYWDHVDGLPMWLDDERSGQFVWCDLGQEQQLMIKAPLYAAQNSAGIDVDDDGEGEDGNDGRWLKPLPLIPPWYLDMGTGGCGKLRTTHSNQEVKWLASAPPVPAAQAEQLVTVMSEAQIQLPQPKPIAQNWREDVIPKPVLTLGVVKARDIDSGFFRHYQRPFQTHEIAPILQLAFDYDGQLVESHDDADFIQQVTNGQLQLIQRDTTQETGHLIELLELASEFGFFPVKAYEDEAVIDQCGQFDLVLWPFDSQNPLGEFGGGRLALDFLEKVLPELRSKGWQVIIEPEWPCHLHEDTPQLSGRIDEQDGSWFSLGLYYEIDGKEFALLPVLTRLVNEMSEELLNDEQALQQRYAGQHFVVRLKDGRYAKLPMEPLIPALQFVRDLHDRMHMAESPAVFDMAEALMGCGVKFKGGQALIDLGARLRELAAPTTEVMLPDTFTGDLRPYQKTGMGWMLALSEAGFGGILADDMGLGKTVQTLAFLAARHQLATSRSTTATTTEKPLINLLVVPTSLVSNWVIEAARFVPGMSVLALHGPDRAKDFARLAEHDLVITTYPLLHRDKDILFGHDYDTVILDEAQYVKNPTSQIAKLIRDIPTRHRLALTGTPMENNLQELWCLFDWLIPGLLGNRKAFNESFRKPIEKEKSLGHQATLSKRIAPFLLRRTKDQVVTDLPPRTDIVESVTLSGQQRALYETVRVTMQKRVREALAQKGLANSKITVLDALLKLRQACCDPQLVKLASAANITTSAKRTRLIELLESLIAQGRRVLVFSQFVEMLRLIESDIKTRGWDYLMLTGQTKNRGDLVKTFQAGEVPVFLISLKAGGVGLNLTAADTVILYDPWWNPAIERQAMDRAHRIGQGKPVFVHRLIAQGTVETQIADIQARKQALIDSVFDPDIANTTAMSEDEIMALFAPLAD